MGKGRSWQVLLGIGAGLLVAGYALSLSGCSDATATTGHPPASQLKEGLNVLDAHDASWGFNAAYVKAGRVVYIESRTGPPKPEVYRISDPDEPSNEMDLRFVDQSGRTFWAQRGGDSWIDPSWEADTQWGSMLAGSTTLAERDLDYTVAQEGAKALTATLPAVFQEHAYHLNVFAKLTPITQDPVAVAKAGVDTPYASFASSTSTTLTSYKYSKATSCAVWICAASHSAVQMQANGAAVINACNHGTCPGGSGMSKDCASAGGPFAYGVSLNGETAGNTSVTGGCGTPYNWDSGGYDHLCNDDAAYELWETKGGSTSSSQGNSISFQWYGASHCRGSACGQSPSYFACDCQTFNGCSGDWNTPNCP